LKIEIRSRHQHILGTLERITQGVQYAGGSVKFGHSVNSSLAAGMRPRAGARQRWKLLLRGTISHRIAPAKKIVTSA
jgi:hypothetical protein